MYIHSSALIHVYILQTLISPTSIIIKKKFYHQTSIHEKHNHSSLTRAQPWILSTNSFNSNLIWGKPFYKKDELQLGKKGFNYHKKKFLCKIFCTN